MCFFLRPVLTAKKAGAQLAQSSTFVLSPPATSSLWHRTGYSPSARPAPSLPNPWRVVSNMLRADTDWCSATLMWMFVSLEAEFIKSSRFNMDLLSSSSSLTTSLEFDEQAPCPPTDPSYLPEGRIMHPPLLMSSLALESANPETASLHCLA